MQLTRTRAEFVGCYRTTRKCYHCDFEMEVLVLKGEELTPPNASDYCIGLDNHLKHGIFRNPFVDDGSRFGKQRSDTILRSRQNE